MARDPRNYRLSYTKTSGLNYVKASDEWSQWGDAYGRQPSGISVRRVKRAKRGKK